MGRDDLDFVLRSGLHGSSDASLRTRHVYLAAWEKCSLAPRAESRVGKRIGSSFSIVIRDHFCDLRAWDLLGFGRGETIGVKRRGYKKIQR